MKRKHDDEFTDDELASILHGHAMLLHERLTDDEKHGEAGEAGDNDRGVHYERVRGIAEPGSFRLPHQAVHTLGQGDPRTAGRVIASMFGTSADDPLTIPPETVRALGHGDVKAGHRVLQKFVTMLRSGGVRSRVIHQPDGNHARG